MEVLGIGDGNVYSTFESLCLSPFIYVLILNMKYCHYHYAGNLYVMPVLLRLILNKWKEVTLQVKDLLELIEIHQKVLDDKISD